MAELDSQPSITSLRDSSSIICRQGGSLDIAGSLNIPFFSSSSGNHITGCITFLALRLIGPEAALTLPQWLNKLI